MSDNIEVNQLEVAASLANDVVILFTKMKYPRLTMDAVEEYILDSDGNYTQSAQELFNFWNEYYFDKLEKHKIL